MTEEYIRAYNQRTDRLLKQASEIDWRSLARIDTKYRLWDIVYVLRKKYADPAFRRHFVGNMEFRGIVPWTKGFCALTTICIYELYGGPDIWEPSAIRPGQWEHGPVVFLRELDTGLAFDPSGDQFAPLRVPYDIGTPIHRRIKDMKTPNRAKFIHLIQKELNGMCL